MNTKKVPMAKALRATKATTSLRREEDAWRWTWGGQGAVPPPSPSLSLLLLLLLALFLPSLSTGSTARGLTAPSKPDDRTFKSLIGLTTL